VSDRIGRAGLVLAAIFIAAFFALMLAAPSYTFLGSAVADAVFALGYLAYAVVAALILVRHPRQPVGLLLAFVGVTGTATMALDRYAALGVVEGPGLPVWSTAAWISGWSWVPGDIAITTLLLLLFPRGSLPGRRWRPVAWLAVIAIVGLPAARAFKAGFVSENRAGVVNPYALPGILGEAAARLEIVFFFAWALAAALSVAALIAHLRRSRGIERQQLKWLGSAMVFLALAFVSVVPVYVFVGYSAAAMWIVGPPSVGITLLPIAAGIAILRYRLFEIDVLIRRTLVYGALSVTLVTTYLALVVVVQTALRPFTAGSELAVAGSTLATLALVQPLRSRIQAVVDRRFYRSRYDAVRTLEAFAVRMRDQVDLETVRGEVLDVVATALRPAHAGVWLREEGPAT
jgi:hypothetical protein